MRLAGRAEPAGGLAATLAVTSLLPTLKNNAAATADSRTPAPMPSRAMGAPAPPDLGVSFGAVAQGFPTSETACTAANSTGVVTVSCSTVSSSTSWAATAEGASPIAADILFSYVCSNGPAWTRPLGSEGPVAQKTILNT